MALAALGAVPLGILAGMFGWRAIADYLGVVPSPVVPVLPILALGAVVLVAGVGAGLGVAERFRRRRPGELLRTE